MKMCDKALGNVTREWVIGECGADDNACNGRHGDAPSMIRWLKGCATPVPLRPQQHAGTKPRALGEVLGAGRPIENRSCAPPA